MSFVSLVFLFDLCVLSVVMVAGPIVLIALAFRKKSHD